MIRFRCPTCRKVLKAPDDRAGRKIECPGCGQRLQIPPIEPQPAAATAAAAASEESSVASAESDRRILLGLRRDAHLAGPGPLPKVPLGRKLFRLVTAFLIISGVLATGWFFLCTGNGPFAGPPVTCREVVERLEARGMDIGWTHGRRGNFVYVYDAQSARSFKGKHLPDFDADRLDRWQDDADVEAYLGQRSIPYAAVRQLETPQDAAEKAGARKHAFCWGRFVVEGDSELVKQIKNRLWPLW